MSAPQPRLDDLRIERANAEARPNRAFRWIMGSGVALALAALGWWLTRTQPLVVPTALARAETSTGPDRTVLNASGYVVARREATVSSKFTGKVVTVNVEEGVSVQAAQVLAHLDDTNVQASLQLARAQLAAAGTAFAETRVRLREAEKEFKRQSALQSSGASAQAELDRAEAASQAWQARLAQQQSEQVVAERNVAIWQQQLEDTVIRAPFAGIVTSKNAQPGEMISPMSSGGFTRTGICTIVDMQSLEIEIDVNESYLNRVTPGQAVDASLDAYPGWKIPGKVIAIIPTADRQKSTVKVRVGFDQLDPRVLPQMAVKVAFREATGPSAVAPIRVSRGVVIPKSAVRSWEGRDTVFIIRQGRAERREVTIGGSQNNDSTVSAGLAAGDRVITEVPAELREGALVTEKNL